MVAAALWSMVLAAGAGHPQGVQVVAADAGSVTAVWVKGHQREMCHLAREGGCFFELPPGPAVLVLEGQDIAIDVPRGVSRFAYQKGPAVLFAIGLLGFGAGAAVAAMSFMGAVLTSGSPLSIILLGAAMVGALAALISVPIMAVGLLLPRGGLHPADSASPGGFVAQGADGARPGGV